MESLRTFEEICYENDYTFVWWNRKYAFLRIEYKGIFVGDDFKVGGQLQIDTFLEHQGAKILYDLRMFPVTTLSNTDWIKSYYLPTLIKHGLRFMAIVPAEDFYGKLSSEHIINKIDRNLVEIVFFPNIEEAEAWISNVP